MGQIQPNYSMGQWVIWVNDVDPVATLDLAHTWFKTLENTILHTYMHILYVRYTAALTLLT